MMYHPYQGTLAPSSPAPASTPSTALAPTAFERVPAARGLVEMSDASTHLADLVAQTRDCLAVFEATAAGQLVLVWFNPASAAAFQLTPASIDRSLAELFPAEVVRGIQECLDDGTRSVEQRWPGSPPRWYHAVLTTLSGEGAPRVGVAWRDITAQKQADAMQQRQQAHLAHAQKLETLGTLASGFAHDFNNILAVLSANTEMLNALVGNLPPALENLTQMTAGIHRATELVRRVLTFSRKRTPTRKPSYLGPMIHEALQSSRPLIPPEVSLVSNLPAEGPFVLADIGQIQQVVIALCTNALQALPPEGGHIRVALEAIAVDDALATHALLRAGPHVRLRVQDDGCGMDGATKARLFEPFFTTRPPGVGIGLGLTVVARILEGHQAGCVVSSQPGAGATFDLYFPVEEAEKPLPRTGPSVQVLFVDDEEYLVTMATTLLQRLGYEVTAFTNPEQALAAFTAEPARYGLVITDLTMPGLKGTDLAKKIREVRAEMPILLATGFTGPVELERARSLGFTDVLEKPFIVPRLVEAIQHALGEARPKS